MLHPTSLGGWKKSTHDVSLHIRLLPVRECGMTMVALATGDVSRNSLDPTEMCICLVYPPPTCMMRGRMSLYPRSAGHPAGEMSMRANVLAINSKKANSSVPDLDLGRT